MKYLYPNKNWEINKDYNVNRLLYLLIDRPNTIIDNVSCKTIIWLNKKNKEHRDYDLPTYVSYNNKISNVNWIKNGKHHRKNNKPAIIDCCHYKVYYTDGVFIKTEKI